VKSCDVDEGASVLDKLEEDARSLIKVIGEKRNTRVGASCFGASDGRSAHTVC